MSIDIRLSNVGNVGTDYPADLNTFINSYISSGFPYMEEDDQMVLLGETDGADTQIIILNGADLAYDMGSHTVTGSLDEMIVGTLGESWNDDGSFDLDSDGHITGYTTLIAFEDLDLVNSSGRGDVHNLVAELMYLGGSSERELETFDSILDQPQKIYGSAGNDVIYGTAHDDTIDGGDGRDVILGGNGDDVINGGDGVDVLVGSLGDDTLSGEGDNDKLRGRWGDDVLHGGDGDDELLGNADDDELFGGAGNDLMIGGIGSDTIDGGTGNDIVHYRTADEPDGDVVLGYDDGVVFRLRRFDANESTASNDSFDFLGDDDFSGDGGELRYEIVGRDTVVYGDVSGDGEADFSFTVVGVQGLTESDFIL